MIDDQIRKYVRAEIEYLDAVDIWITRIASNLRDAVVNPIPVEAINISARGVKFESNLLLPVGIMVELRMKIEDKIVQTSGKIVRVEQDGDNYCYGVSFSILKEYNKIIISSFIKRKAIDQIHKLRGQ